MPDKEKIVEFYLSQAHEAMEDAKTKVRGECEKPRLDTERRSWCEHSSTCVCACMCVRGGGGSGVSACGCECVWT